jgi:methylated-DNA-[protein]-cysteine S-methyltransferase
VKESIMNTNVTNTTLFSTTMSSPIKPLTIVANERAVVAIMWDTETADADPEARNPVDAGLGPVVAVDEAGDAPAAAAAGAVLAKAVAQLDEYFRGERTDFDLPLEPAGTAFQREAWQALLTIPFGETISYGEQAVRLGDKNKSRAVGAANGKNPIPIVVPCHRVVGSNGHLTGFAGGLDTKAWLLDHEFGVRAGG